MIDNEKALKWSKIEWANCYKLYRATKLYELDDYLDFENFKNKVLSDHSFYSMNQLKEGMDEPDYNPWQIKPQKKHLVKRRNLNYKAEDGWLCEVSRGKKPSGSKVELGDIVYIAQNGYAIFASGIVYGIKKIELSSFEEFVNYSLNESNIKDDDYWTSKIRDYSNNKSDAIYHILEYKLEYVTQLDVSYPLEDRFLNQSAWYYLEDDFELMIPKNDFTVTQHIPTQLREKIYHKYKVKTNDHIIDIDHIVPADLGGPGNIEENLAPVSPSINRRKGNRVPSKLFDLASKFDIKIPKEYRISHDLFYSNTEAKNLGREVVKKINLQSIEDIRSDYNQIRLFHFPGLIDE